MSLELLTLDEVAAQVRLSPCAVRRAIGRGELAASKPAGRIRIAREAVEEWLAGTAVDPWPIEPRSTVPARLNLSGLRDSVPVSETSFRSRARRKTD